MRINGLLLTTHTPSNKVSRRLASRLKVLANLNIAERRLPQDGRIKLGALLTIDVDLRISTLPTQWGKRLSFGSSIDIKWRYTRINWDFLRFNMRYFYKRFNILRG
jgi:hypothetical protein